MFSSYVSSNKIKKNSKNIVIAGLCFVSDGEMGISEKQSEEQMQTGLLIGILLTMVLMVLAVLATIYMYYHPTSSASLFFIEVSTAAEAVQLMEHLYIHYYSKV